MNRRPRTYALLLLFILVKQFGNLSMAWGMKHFPETVSLHPLLYLRAMTNPYVVVGIAMLILSVLTRMALLSLADLSFILPLTAVGYVLSALMGKFLLGEEVTMARWVGVALVFLGSLLVSSTPQMTPVQAIEETPR